MEEKKDVKWLYFEIPTEMYKKLINIKIDKRYKTWKEMLKKEVIDRYE